jgi:hypothetical protein
MAHKALISEELILAVRNLARDRCEFIQRNHADRREEFEPYINQLVCIGNEMQVHWDSMHAEVARLRGN